MQKGKEIYTEKISAGSRTYFFDIKKSIKEDEYIVISENKKKDDGTYESHKIIIFKEDLEKFSEAFIRTILKLK